MKLRNKCLLPPLCNCETKHQHQQNTLMYFFSPKAWRLGVIPEWNHSKDLSLGFLLGSSLVTNCSMCKRILRLRWMHQEVSMIVTCRGVTRNFIGCNEDELISAREDKIHNTACWLGNGFAANWLYVYRRVKRDGGIFLLMKVERSWLAELINSRISKWLR